MAYFAVTSPLPGVYHLEDPRGVFVTLLVGDQRALLVDTGMGIGNTAAAVRELTDLPLTVCNSHGHVDHIGGNYLFPKVLMPFRDMEYAKRDLQPETKEHLLSIPAPVPDDFDRAAFLSYDLENVEPLEAGTRFDLGGLTVETVSLPSHTPGSLGFYVKERELLLSGDSIAPLVYLVFPESSSLRDYVTVLEGARSIPAKWILSAHTSRLIPKEELEEYIACGKAVKPEETLRRKDPLFPKYPGRMFIYKDSILVFTPDKLGPEKET